MESTCRQIELAFLNMIVAGLASAASPNTIFAPFSVEQVVAQSESSTVGTIVQHGTAMAVGFAGARLYRTPLWDNVEGAFGVAHGQLAFTQNGILWLGDLRTRKRHPILLQHGVSQAEWSPDGTKLAILASREGRLRLLLYLIMPGAHTNLSPDVPVQKGFLRWSPDGARLYYLAACPGACLVTQYFGSRGRTKTALAASNFRLLEAAPDGWLAAPDGTIPPFPLSTDVEQIVRVPGGLILTPGPGAAFDLAGWDERSSRLGVGGVAQDGPAARLGPFQ